MEHAKILSHFFILFIRQFKKVFVFTFILAFDLIERHEIRNFSQLVRYKVKTNNSVTYSNQIFPEPLYQKRTENLHVMKRIKFFIY
jgi:hypothetical protein